VSSVLSEIRTARRRAYLHRDRRYVAEFCAWAFPQDPTWINLRVGPVPLELRLRYPQLDVDRWARVWAKTADAVVITPSHLVLIEGELRRPIAAIGELVVYRSMVRQTTALADYASLPIRTILLTPIPDPSLEAVLRDLQLEVVIYMPEWVGDYLREVQRL